MRAVVINWTEKRESLLGSRPEQNLLPDIKLPVLPLALTKFSQLADNPNCEIPQLAAVIESDTGLTCQLLKAVNASVHGLRHRISSAHHAIAALGIRRAKLLLIEVALRNALPARQLKLVNLATFWNANLERAIFARGIARLLNTDEHLAFSAALLADFLLPALTNDRDEIYVNFFREAESETVGLYEFERNVFGRDHAELAARVMFAWGFPDDLICCVLHHHHGLSLLADEELQQSAAAAVAVASLIPDPLRQSAAGIEQLLQLDNVWNAFDLESFAAGVHREYGLQSLDSANYIPLHFRLQKHLSMVAS